MYRLYKEIIRPFGLAAIIILAFVAIITLFTEKRVITINLDKEGKILQKNDVLIKGTFVKFKVKSIEDYKVRLFWKNEHEWLEANLSDKTRPLILNWFKATPPDLEVVILIVKDKVNIKFDMLDINGLVKKDIQPDNKIKVLWKKKGLYVAWFKWKVR